MENKRTNFIFFLISNKEFFKQFHKTTILDLKSNSSTL